MPESPYEDLARSALLEITPADTVGSYLETTDEGDGVVSILFASAMPGYPDWRWTVSVAHVDGIEPTVLETELMPADGALLAPDWLPWSDRLAEYKAAQEGTAPDEESDDDSDDADDDSEDDDESDDDESDDDELDEDDVLGNDVLHGGDLDGVDIDDLDADPGSGEDDDSDDEDSDDYDDDSDDDDEGEKTY